MGEYNLWDEAQRIDEQDSRIRLGHALDQVDERYGDYLRMAKTAKEFDVRWRRVSNEVLNLLADEGIFPKPRVVRKVRAKLRPNFERSVVAASKTGWTYSPDLRVYATEGSDPFVCPCGTPLGRIGMNLCEGCGRAWNSWGITEAGKQKTLCREVNSDQTLILAKRRKS